MRASFEELDYRRTELGELILRRRRSPGLGDVDIFEVKLNGDLLMSSLLTESERQLAGLSLPVVAADRFEVLVGGLGLGETAAAVLTDRRVSALTVVELLPEVIEWHERGLVPLGEALCTDPRCRFFRGDFFRIVADPDAAGLAVPDGGFGAVLVDIDHAPDSWLHPGHEKFYGVAGLRGAAALLREGGVFGFWSAGLPNEDFAQGLREVFADVETHDVPVYNPLVDSDQSDTIYVARGARWDDRAEREA